jgi:FkbM family methyltransferase
VEELGNNQIIEEINLNKYHKGTHYDINGVLLPSLGGTFYEKTLGGVVLSSFGHHIGYTNEEIEAIQEEGFYIYKNDIKKGDIVIDAGAYIGDFSAYAAYKGATVYAFEPSKCSLKWLKETAKLNPSIHPIPLGLGEKNKTIRLFKYRNYSGSNTTDFRLIIKNMFSPELRIWPTEALSPLFNIEKIKIVTIDGFVRENNISRVDYIKADIEGMERYMLMGAREVLKNMAPELSICTYHLPDDREVLKKLILEANPDYQIVQQKKKLHAFVP